MMIYQTKTQNGWKLVRMLMLHWHVLCSTPGFYTIFTIMLTSGNAYIFFYQMLWQDFLRFAYLLLFKVLMVFLKCKDENIIVQKFLLVWNSTLIQLLCNAFVVCVSEIWMAETRRTPHFILRSCDRSCCQRGERADSKRLRLPYY